MPRRGHKNGNPSQKEEDDQRRPPGRRARIAPQQRQMPGRIQSIATRQRCVLFRHQKGNSHIGLCQQVRVWHQQPATAQDRAANVPQRHQGPEGIALLLQSRREPQQILSGRAMGTEDGQVPPCGMPKPFNSLVQTPRIDRHPPQS